MGLLFYLNGFALVEGTLSLSTGIGTSNRCVSSHLSRFVAFRPIVEVSEEQCHEIESYLTKALLTCGKKLVLGLIFDDDPLCDFEEDIQELRLKGHENMMKAARNEFAEIKKLREKAKSMMDMATVYVIEDESKLPLRCTSINY